MLTATSKRKVRNSHIRGIDADVRARAMLPVEAAYVGAMLDAEGCIYWVVERYPSFVVVNTDPEILSALLRATGTGSIGAMSDRPRQTRVCYQFKIARLADIVFVVRQLIPYSTKAQVALERIESIWC